MLRKNIGYFPEPLIMRNKSTKIIDTSTEHGIMSEEDFDPKSAFVHMAVKNQKAETQKLGPGNAFQFNSGLLVGGNGSLNGSHSGNSSFVSSPSLLSHSGDSGVGPGGSTYNLFQSFEAPIPDYIQGALQNASRGNQHFVMKQYKEAAHYFTEAIKLDPQDVRFFGNRSLCYLMLKEYEKALEDAATAISLESTWAKGYFRKGSALEAQQNLIEAEKAYDFAVSYSNGTCPEAADAKRRVMIAQLVKLGFSLEQSTAAILQYQSVKKASDVLLKCSMCCKSNLKEVFDSDDEEALINGKWGRLGSTGRPSSNGSAHSGSSAATNTTVSGGKGSVNGKSVKTRPKKTPSPPTEIKAGDPLTDPRNPLKCDTLWIGNLVNSTTEKTIASLVGRFGKVKQSNLMLEKHCAFVSFYDWRNAGDAMGEIQGKEVNGQKVLVKYPDRAIGNAKSGPHTSLVLRKSNPQK